MLNRRFLLFWAAGDMYLFGTSLAFLGATLLPLSQRFHLDAARAGDLFLTMHFGSLLACLAAGIALDRFGTRPVLFVALICLGSGLWGLTAANSLSFLGACIFVIGIAGGGLNTGAIALVSDTFAEDRKSALNVLSIFFGCGAIVLSFVIGAASRAWPLFLEGSAIVSLVWAGAGFLTRFPPARETHGFSLRAAFSTLRNPQAALFAILILCQMGNEITMGGWIATFLAREDGASAQSATLALSGYWIAIVLGRLMAAGLLRWGVGASQLVVASGLGAAACTGILLASSEFLVGVAAVVSIGLCYAAMLPTTLAMAGDRFSRFTGTVFGVLFAVGVIGSMLFPWATGHLARNFNLRVGLALPLAAAVVITVLELVLIRKASVLDSCQFI